MTLLDTNIILRFILNDDPKLSLKAKNIFEKISLEQKPIFVSLLAISEVVFILERTYKLSKPEIVKSLSVVFSHLKSGVEKQDLIKQTFEHYTNKNVSFVDAFHVALMNKKKIKDIYSFDHDFDKFPNIKRLED